MTLSINLNAPHLNGITPFDLAIHGWLLDTLVFNSMKIYCPGNSESAVRRQRVDI
mgnify:CR=1 FL=1